MSYQFVEEHSSAYKVQWGINEVLYSEKTPYQNLSIVDFVELGRALVLDDAVQTTIQDEFYYHEMIAHVPLFTHPDPQDVLIIGGGDGGTAREVLKHKSVRRVDLVEIDERVIAACKKYLPEISCSFDDPRLNVIIADGVEYIKRPENEYDVVIIDSSDPVGPAVELFSKDFYQNVYHSLRPDGIMVAQTDSPCFNAKFFKEIFFSISAQFPLTKVYLVCVPSYISGFWSFTLGSKKYNPVEDYRKEPVIATRFYTPELHKASFILPRFIEELLK